jgi:GTP:adenosylcobinamide-phosphate guanylyltransferase
MEILIKHYGNSRTSPSKTIELTFKSDESEFTVDVTNLKGLVDVNLIENLRQIADELEEQNREVNKLTN